ncbi:MAG: DUF4176 domain-containing protein [Bacilli bacterium]
MKEKYLPIGTVVTLNGGTKRVMVIGYCPIAEDKKMFDYSACTYPEGIISSDKTLAFNHEQISQIHFIGLEDSEQAEFNNKIKEMLKSLNDLKEVELTNTNVVNSEQGLNTNGDIPTLDVLPKQPEFINDIMNNTN